MEGVPPDRRGGGEAFRVCVAADDFTGGNFVNGDTMGSRCSLVLLVNESLVRCEDDEGRLDLGTDEG